MLAFESYDYSANIDRLIITDSSGKRLKSVPWKKEWYYIADWLNNENLLIGIPASDQTTGRMSSTFVVYNPFTLKSQILEPHFPNIYENDSIAANWSGWRETVYNQELDHVVYLQGGPGGDGPFHYVLRDIHQKLNIVSFTVIGGTYSIPRWSPSGTEFLFANSQIENIQITWPSFELLSIGQNGQVTQLTHLTKYYPWVYIDDYSWSPDERYIAFWFSWWADERPGFELSGNRYLALVDTEDNKVVNYCIKGKPLDSGRMPQPVWSPDGKQLAIESVSTDGMSHVVLVDTIQDTAIQIGEDMTPIGWMK